MKKTCTVCGKEFVTYDNDTVCYTCTVEKKREKQRNYTSNYLRNNNMTSIHVFKDDSAKLKAMAKEKKTNIASVVKELLCCRGY